MATTSWMPDLASRSASFGSSAVRVSAGMTFAWSTIRPVSAGKLSGEGAQRPRQSERPESAAAGQTVQTRHGDAPRQNFTCGGVCALSFAANSAIGLFERKKVEAHSTPGKVLSSVL